METRESSSSVVTPSASFANAAAFADNRMHAQASGPTESEVCRRNVMAMMLYQAFNAFAWGVVFGPVFDKYLYHVGGDRNSMVGAAESVSGLVSLVLAVPIGFLVDSRPAERARLLRHCIVACWISCIVMIAAVLQESLWLMYVALAFNGVYYELSTSVTEAIFADSTEPGKSRDQLISRKMMIQVACGACGPAITVLGFVLLGDTWKLWAMQVLLIIGLCIMPLTALILLRFTDPPAAQRAAELQRAEKSQEVAQTGNGPLSQTPGNPPNPGAGESSSALPVGLLSRRTCGPLSAKHVPYIMGLSNFVTCIGAGMTVKFFALFFIKDWSFTPVAINSLMMAYTLWIAVFIGILHKAGARFGRAQTSFAFFSCNLLGFYALANLTNLPLLVFVFLMRGAFANSVSPLDKAILTDYTPSARRGCWNAVQSLTSMTWCGSAFIGGLLADSRDYRFTFLVTGGVYLAAMVLYSPLLCLVPRRKLESSESPTATLACALTGAARDLELEPSSSEAHS